MADDPGPFKDAEAWLAERGVDRDPIEVPLTPPADPEPAAAPATPAGAVGTDAAPATPAGAAEPDAAAPSGGPPVSAREAGRLAEQAHDEASRRAADAAATPDPDAPSLERDVAEAVAFLRRSTAGAPQSEGRLREKLTDRGTAAPVIELALERARRERLVDDRAMAAALVEERQAKGHAPARIRRDLRSRGFDDELLDEILASADQQDLEAAAFGVAREKALRNTGLSPESAYRRVVSHVVRRGYPEALARKVAREAVFTTRDDERTAGH